MSGHFLGPFQLVRPIAAGGMGQVWGAVHGRTPVAIKVLTGGAAWDPSYRSMFRNEVRAAARLTHPGIIHVLDHGEIPASVAAGVDGGLVEGSPYLVMEYASGGRLNREGMRWRRLRPLLRHLLGALGHAHARGVVHRDLKPSNILLAGRDDLRGGAKISDFGIAWVGDGPVDAAFAGTAQFMAPEQHAGAWASYGPWTDLYALGVVTWWLVSGRTPFQGDGHDVARAHLHEALPPLAPQFPVPKEFETWVRTLLHKDPAARYRCAADAIAGLDEVPDIDDDGRATLDIPASELDIPTHLHAEAPQGSSSGMSTSSTGRRDGGQHVLAGPPLPPEPAPTARARLPTDWREPIAHVPVALRGAGLGLHELRDPPFVGRATERDQLWRALRGADRTGRPRLVWLQGGAGTGKSRLAEWVVKRAHATAGVHSVLVRDDGIDLAIARSLGVDRLTEPDRTAGIHERLKRCPEPALAASLAEALDPTRATSPRARHGVYRRLLAWHSLHRPALLVLDDAHRADHALHLAEQVLTRPLRGRRAVVVVLVTRDDALATHTAQRRRIETLADATRSPKRIALGPLPPTERQELLTSMGLSGPLAAQVDARSGGNPMFMVQLVGDWIAAHRLRLGPDGFVIDGPEPPVPASLAAVWRDRVEQLLAHHPAPAGLWLERAAAWGMAIDDDDWAALCGMSPADVPHADMLVAQLLDGRLAIETAEGWGFAHALLREGLLTRAADRGSLPEHHRACVRVRLGHDPVPHGAIGTHLVASGQPGEAVDHFLRAFDTELTRRGLLAAQQIYLPCKEAMQQTLDGDDPRWSTLWRHRSILLLRQGDIDEAIERAEMACAHADTRDLDRWSEARLALASALQARGDLAAALHALKSSVTRRLSRGRRDLLLARLLERMGSIARARGQAADADQWTTQALGLLYRHDAPPGRVAGVLMEQGLNAAHSGHYDRALGLFAEAQETWGDGIPRVQRAHLHNNRADALAKLGRFGDAADAFAQAASDLSALGADPVVPVLNLGLARLRQGKAREAARGLAPLTADNRGRPRHLAALVEVAQATASAMLGDLRAVERQLPPAAKALQDAGFVDPDLLTLYQLAAEALASTTMGPIAWGYLAQQAAAAGDEALAAQAKAKALAPPE